MDAPIDLKLGARYYNPTTARFTQPDPSGQEPNTYNYATCNPANSTDPTGLATCDSQPAFTIGLVLGGGLLFAPVTAGESFVIGTMFAVAAYITKDSC